MADPTGEPAAAPRDLPPQDIVSQLQDEINGVCYTLFNSLGALQRDAPPLPVKDDLVLAPAPAPGVLPPEVRAENVEVLRPDVAISLAPSLTPPRSPRRPLLFLAQAQIATAASDIALSLERLKKVITALPDISTSANEEEAECLRLQEAALKARERHQAGLEALQAREGNVMGLYAAIDDALREADVQGQ